VVNAFFNIGVKADEPDQIASGEESSALNVLGNQGFCLCEEKPPVLDHSDRLTYCPLLNKSLSVFCIGVTQLTANPFVGIMLAHKDQLVREGDSR